MILDAVMPQMGGFEAIAAIRSRPGLSTTPAIVVSGLEDVESCVNALAVGADDFVVKPYEHRETPRPSAPNSERSKRGMVASA